MKNRIATVIIKSAELMKKAIGPIPAIPDDPPLLPPSPHVPVPMPANVDAAQRQAINAANVAGAAQAREAQRAFRQQGVQTHATQRRDERRDRLARRGYASTSVRPVRQQLARVQQQALRARQPGAVQPVAGQAGLNAPVQNQVMNAMYQQPNVNYYDAPSPMPRMDTTAPIQQVASTLGTAHAAGGGTSSSPTAMGQTSSPYSSLSELNIA